MEMKEIKISVPKEITEVGECLGDILRVTGQQLNDGFKAGDDIPPILANSFSGLIKAIEGIQNIGEEFKLEPFAAELGLQIPIQMGARDMMIAMKKD